MESRTRARQEKTPTPLDFNPKNAYNTSSDTPTGNTSRIPAEAPRARRSDWPPSDWTKTGLWKLSIRS